MVRLERYQEHVKQVVCKKGDVIISTEVLQHGVSVASRNTGSELVVFLPIAESLYAMDAVELVEEA